MSDTRRAAKPVVAASAGMKRARRCVGEGWGDVAGSRTGASPSSDSASAQRSSESKVTV